MMVPIIHIAGIVPITYIAGFVDNPAEALSTFINIDWEQRDTPRMEYYCNDFPNPYVYGRGKGERTYHPRPWPQLALDIRAKLEATTDSKFEVLFLNRYKNQSNHLGWHADDSPEMDDARPIGIISFGVEREIWFRNNDNKEVHKLVLGNGSLCLMGAGMQDLWQHRIPKASFQCGERISMTFRGYVQ